MAGTKRASPLACRSEAEDWDIGILLLIASQICIFSSRRRILTVLIQRGGWGSLPGCIHVNSDRMPRKVIARL